METTYPLAVRLRAQGAARWLRRAVVLVAILAVLLILRLTVLAPAAVPVTVFRVAAGRVEESVTNSKAGTVKSRRRATLSPEVGGRLAQLPARKGARVKTGDVLHAHRRRGLSGPGPGRGERRRDRAFGLTSLGEGTRRAIAADFSLFGTNVMAIHRGKTTTSGSRERSAQRLAG